MVAVTSLSKNKVDYTGSFFPNGYFNELNADYEAAGLAGYQNRVNNPYSSTFKQASQEIRYVSVPDAPIKWLAGAYGEYSDSQRAYTATSTFDPAMGIGDGVTQTSRGQTKTTSFAVFSDASFAATDKLEIFGGLRIGHDKKKFNYDFSVDNPAWTALGMDAGFVTAQRETLSTTYAVPRIGVRYQLTDDTQTYASVSRGFKSGGFNIGFVQKGDERPYKNESLVSYQIGLKSELIKNVLSLDTALFYIDRKNQQVQTYNALTQTTPVANAPKSRSLGGEVTLKAQLDEHCSGYAGLGYTDATYVKFENAPATGTTGVVDASGKQQQFVSRYTGKLGAAYAWDIGAYNLKGRGDLGYQYRSSFYFDQSNTQKQGGYGLVNARLSVGNNEYEGYVWGENLSNERYRTSAADFGYGRLVTVGNPRTFGVGVSKTF
ncbi:TonB-dependent receptor [Pseudomonas sp. 9.1(2019)]|uniref:TonB-dependent receptor n=1 Tax=Pseudomonas sp. 9.1(2019) TaxID=2580568 RepID=UPI0013715DE9|nr:TonB-dependent receptor [Pseudomonas sp. 9.1(2019)]